MYQDKQAYYFSEVREDLIALIPKRSNNKVLEIGAAGGDTLVEIKNRKIASEVVGLDLMHLPDTKQSHPNIDKFIFGNIESMDLKLPDDHFDVIICGDVLEHLVDPWTVLTKLRRFLTGDGVIIASIPNIREISTLYKIVVKGDFAYRKDGILDKTHLRFFCKKNIISLLSSTSYRQLSIHSFFENNQTRIINKFTFNLFNGFLSQRYIVVAAKN